MVMVRPRRQAAAVAEQAAVASAAAELDDAEDEWDDDEGEDDHGDEDDEDDDAPPLKVQKKGAAAGKAKKGAAETGRRARPSGRKPKGKEWDAEVGDWVAVGQSSSLVPAAGQSFALAVTDGAVSEGNGPAAAGQEGPLEAAGADLPNWQVEYITKPNGRTATKFHGPGGAVASTRSQARQGGKLPPVAQKPIGEMTLRELIAERSRGEPMQSARHKGKRKKGEPAAARGAGLRPGMSAEERMAAEDADVVANGPDLAPTEGRYAEEEAGGGGRRGYREQREEVDGQVDDGSDDGAGNEDGGTEGGAEGEASGAVPFAPQLRINDEGQIVMDEASLQVTAQTASG